MSALEAMLLTQLSVMKILSENPCGKGGMADDLAYCPISTMQQTITAHSLACTSPQQGAMRCSDHKRIDVNMLKHKKSGGAKKTRKRSTDHTCQSACKCKTACYRVSNPGGGGGLTHHIGAGNHLLAGASARRCSPPPTHSACGAAVPCASAEPCCGHGLAESAGCSPASRPSSWPQRHPHALSCPDQSSQCCQQHAMSTPDDEAVYSTRLILPILGLVMHAPACKARTNHTCPDFCKVFTLAVYSQSDTTFTGP